MRQHILRKKVIGGVLVSAVASGALAVGAIGWAGSASATCVSIFGIGNGNGKGCTSSTFSLAVGLGPNTTADASGFLGAAIALGLTNGGATDTTTASTDGNLSFAYAGGPKTSASTRGNLEVAFVQGSQADARAGAVANDFGNVAINFGNGLLPGTNVVRAGGTLNLAVNLGGNGTLANTSDVQTLGILNNAINLGGSGNVVQAGKLGTRAVFSSASNFFGINNTVHAGPGPAAVASAFGGTGKLINRTSPGIHISVGNVEIGKPATVSRTGPGINIGVGEVRTPATALSRKTSEDGPARALGATPHSNVPRLGVAKNDRHSLP
jgi:hypothetical protein